MKFSIFSFLQSGADAQAITKVPPLNTQNYFLLIKNKSYYKKKLLRRTKLDYNTKKTPSSTHFT